MGRLLLREVLQVVVQFHVYLLAMFAIASCFVEKCDVTTQSNIF